MEEVRRGREHEGWRWSPGMVCIGGQAGVAAAAAAVRRWSGVPGDEGQRLRPAAVGTSAAGLFGNFGQANYAAAKMGLVGLARTLAIEGARYGVRANVIALLARTSMTEGLFGGALDEFDPELVVPMPVYLVSESCALSGEIYSAGGGRFARAVIGVTRGWISAEERPAAEDIADNIDLIRADGEYALLSSAAEEIELALSLV